MRKELSRKISARAHAELQQVYAIAAILGLIALVGSIYAIVFNSNYILGGIFVFFTVLFAVISILYHEQTA